MSNFRHALTLLAASLLSVPAAASLIIETHSGGSNPDPLHGYDMIGIDSPIGSTSSSISLPTPMTGEILIQDKDGAALDMMVYDAFDGDDDSYDDSTYGTGWWQYDHGNVYTTADTWIELILPQHVRAISFHVGATQLGNAWVQAVSGGGVPTEQLHFNVSPSNTQGVSVHSADACGSISKVIIEPWLWGFGNVAVEQGTCAQVPEPGPMGLLAAGLVALGVLRRRKAT